MWQPYFLGENHSMVNYSVQSIHTVTVVTNDFLYGKDIALFPLYMNVN